MKFSDIYIRFAFYHFVSLVFKVNGATLTDNEAVTEYDTQIDAEAAAPPTPSVQQTTPLEIRKDSHLTLDDLIVYKPSFEGTQ